MTGTRFAAFLTAALSIWGLVHLYVFWRLASVPWVASHLSRKTLVVMGLACWLSYVGARMLGAWNWEVLAYPLEYLASLWLGTVFLLFVTLLLADLITVGGLVFSEKAPAIRGWVTLFAFTLAAIAVVQGSRAPVVTRYEVDLVDLPKNLDGTTVVVVSDLHLGRLLGPNWLEQRVDQMNALTPDCVLAVGDVVDGEMRHIEPLIPLLQQVKAPLGVWAVTGNHEFYVGVEECVQSLERAGWKVLRDESVEVAPGLVLAGVDDLTARPPEPEAGTPLRRALADRGEGATLLLSHSPLLMEEAAELGVQLMLCGHTHAGQIWPFNYLVKLRYLFVSGRGEVDPMTMLVCRGTGTWGPRMRLWQPSELLHITLRSRE